jgi:hypothetical protein
MTDRQLKTELDMAVERLRSALAQRKHTTSWQEVPIATKGQTLLAVGRDRPLRQEVRYEQV